MTYPPQPGEPGNWPDPSWPSQSYQDPAGQANPTYPVSAPGQGYSPEAGYQPQTADQAYPQPQATGQGYGQPLPPGQGYPQAPGQAYAQPQGAVQGYPQAAPFPSYGYAPPVAQSTNGLAIASLILALAGFFTCGVTAIVGAILGHVARGQIRTSGESGDGLALGGIITGWCITGLFALLGLLYLIGVLALINDPDYSNALSAAFGAI